MNETSATIMGSSLGVVHRVTSRPDPTTSAGCAGIIFSGPSLFGVAVPRAFASNWAVVCYSSRRLAVLPGPVEGKNYAGFLEHADHHVGRLVDAIAELGILDLRLRLEYQTQDLVLDPLGTSNCLPCLIIQAIRRDPSGAV
jgi:hypothetical protein